MPHVQNLKVRPQCNPVPNMAFFSAVGDIYSFACPEKQEEKKTCVLVAVGLPTRKCLLESAVSHVMLCYVMH